MNVCPIPSGNLLCAIHPPYALDERITIKQDVPKEISTGKFWTGMRFNDKFVSKFAPRKLPK
jgi:hypothetical protein